MQMPEHNTTPEIITLEAIGRKIKKLNNLTPHAEVVRGWLSNRCDNEDEYLAALRAIHRIHQKCQFMSGWGISCSLEIYSTLLVGKNLKYFSPEKVKKPREWRRKETQYESSAR